MKILKEFQMKQRTRSAILLVAFSLCWLPGPALLAQHPAETYSFPFRNFSSTDELPWSAYPDWELYRDTYLAISPNADLSNLFEYAFYVHLYRKKLGATGNCYGISLLSVLLNTKGAHLGVCGLPPMHSGDQAGVLSDDDGILGQPDLFLGSSDQTLRYFDQTNFDEQTNDNPFQGMGFGMATLPTFVNIDGDGDWDLFLGTDSGVVRFFENTGTSKDANFVERTGVQHPLNIIAFGKVVVRFVDVDGDRDPDAFAATGSGNIRFFENMGSATEPDLVEQTGNDNLLSGVTFANLAVPAFADIDHDGDSDLFLGLADGTLRFFERESSGFVERTGSNNPANGINVGGNAAPALFDQDGDGDLELIIGASDGAIRFFLNEGDETTPNFSSQTGSNNPMGAIQASADAVPFLLDIDDEDKDDSLNFRGPSDPLVRYTIQRIHGHQANLASVRHFADQVLNFDSLDGRHAFDDVNLSISKDVGVVLSVTSDIGAESGHVLVPYDTKTKPASLHNAKVTMTEEDNDITITGGTDFFEGHHEHTPITIKGAGDGGDLETTILRVISPTEAKVVDDAITSVSNADADWSVPERHYIYVYDCNHPYQDPNWQSWYEMDTNIVIINKSDGKWRYRKSNSTVWPVGENGNLMTMPWPVTTPMDRTPASMGLDAVTLATQMIIMNEGADLLQVTDGEGKRLFIPGTKELDLDEKTGLRSMVQMPTFGGLKKNKSKIYYFLGKRPDELTIQIDAPSGYQLDIADTNNRIEVEAPAVRGGDTLILRSGSGGPKLEVPAQGDAKYTVALTRLAEPGKRAHKFRISDLNAHGPVDLAIDKTNNLTIQTTTSEAHYKLETAVRTKAGVEKQIVGEQIQKAGTRKNLKVQPQPINTRSQSN